MHNASSTTTTNTTTMMIPHHSKNHPNNNTMQILFQILKRENKQNQKPCKIFEKESK
jgi:hypothetical protein